MAQGDNHAKESARLHDAALRCKEIADSLQLGIDQEKLTARIGKATSVHHSEDHSQEWIYQVDEGVFFRINLDRTGHVEGYEFSGFEELIQILGQDLEAAHF